MTARWPRRPRPLDPWWLPALVLAAAAFAAPVGCAGERILLGRRSARRRGGGRDVQSPGAGGRAGGLGRRRRQAHPHVRSTRDLLPVHSRRWARIRRCLARGPRERHRRLERALRRDGGEHARRTRRAPRSREMGSRSGSRPIAQEAWVGSTSGCRRGPIASSPWSTPVPVAALNSTGDEIPRPPGQGGLVMPLAVRPPPSSEYHIEFASRAAASDAWMAPTLRPDIDTANTDVDGFLSDDGLVLHFSSDRQNDGRPGSLGRRARRRRQAHSRPSRPSPS